MSSADINGLIKVASVAAGSAVFLLMIFIIIKRFLYICRPNEVLIFSGRKYKMPDNTFRGNRVEFSGRHWRRPIVEKVDRMSLTIFTIEIISKDAYSRDGIPLSVRAIANVKIANDRKYIHNAIERFLGQHRDALRRVAQETLEGNLRGVLGTMTPIEVNEDRLQFAERLAHEVDDDFNKLGLQLDTLKIQHVTDDREYLASYGRQQVAQVIRDAEIAESDAKNEANKKASDAKKRGEVAHHDADRLIVEQQNEQRRIAADLHAQVETEQKKADAKGAETRFEAEQKLQEVRKVLQQLRLKAEIELPAEAQKRAQELISRGNAAPIEEDGRAVAMVLDMLAKEWTEAGPQARDVFLVQQVEELMATIVGKMSALKVGEVHVIDSGDGSALPNYVSGFPATVTRVLETLKETTGIDVTQILRPSNGVPANGRPKTPDSGGSLSHSMRS
jgi:flotillin